MSSGSVVGGRLPNYAVELRARDKRGRHPRTNTAFPFHPNKTSRLGFFVFDVLDDSVVSNIVLQVVPESQVFRRLLSRFKPIISRLHSLVVESGPHAV